MRNIFYCFFLILLISCEEHVITESESGYTKVFNVRCGNEIDSKSDGSINEATLFIYQTCIETGKRVLYDTVYSESSSIDIELFFSDQYELVYDIHAYTNMGKLLNEPCDSDILFENEKPGDFQGYGSCLSIGSKDLSSLSILVHRYVSKVVVSEVFLDWLVNDNYSFDLHLNNVFIANASMSFDADSPLLNEAGIQSSDNIFVTNSVNRTVKSDGCLSEPIVFYYYDSGSSYLVLQATYIDKEVFYSLPLEIDSNTSTTYTMKIHQVGSDTPLDDECVEDKVSCTAFEMNSDYIENNGSYSDYTGVGILGVDGNIYSSDLWQRMGLDISFAVGIAIGDGKMSFVLHPNARWYDVSFSNPSESMLINGTIPGIVLYEQAQKNLYSLDSTGLSNTLALLDAMHKGTVGELYSPVYAYDTVFSNGEKGYLPSAAEMTLIILNYEEVNRCLSCLECSEFDFFNDGDWWTSTVVKYNDYLYPVSSYELSYDAYTGQFSVNYSTYSPSNKRNMLCISRFVH